MTTPTETPSGRRPYRGFDVEREMYKIFLPKLLGKHEGMFVTIVGDALVGPFETEEEAVRAGYRKFGLGPLYVRQILADERPAVITRDVVICRT